MPKTTAVKTASPEEAPRVLPKSIGESLKLLAETMKKVETMRARLAPYESLEAQLREHLLDNFSKAELNGATGSGLAVAVVKADMPQIADFEAFLKFASRKGNHDLFAKSISSAAWRARIEDKVHVPGVTTFTRVSLRVSKR